MALPTAGIDLYPEDLYPEVIKDVVDGGIDVGSSAARGIGDFLRLFNKPVLDLLPQDVFSGEGDYSVEGRDLPQAQELRDSIAADRAETDEIVKAMPDAVDQFYDENGYVPSAEDLLAYVTGGF